MKKLNKYLLILAAAVFTFTACEQEQKREPSPTYGDNVVAFKSSSVSADINPKKSALKFGVELYRTATKDSAAIAITVLSGDTDIIKVPAVAEFKAGEATTQLLLTFPNAQLDSTYSVVLELDSASRSPYFTGGSQCSVKIAIAEWEDVKTPAIFIDGVIAPVFSFGEVGWYVSYQQKLNPDGSRELRFLNPYRNFKKGAKPDNFGFYTVYPFNEEADVDMTEDFHWDMHVSAEGDVTFPRTYIGVDYGYGSMSAWLMADYLAAKTGADPDYTAHPCGKFDATTNSISIASQELLLFMGSSGYYAGGHIIYLDSKTYQDDHLVIKDYNSDEVEWKMIDTKNNIFESTIFNFTNEKQKLFRALEPDTTLEKNPKSPYKNLYCLKDAYAKGGNFAFYWDTITGEISVPSHQNTKLQFMQEDLFIEAGVGAAVINNLKGTDVTTLTFNIEVVSKNGNYVGQFTETYTFTTEAVIFEKSDFIGNFVMADAEGSEDIEIVEVDDELVILGFTYADSIFCDFDAKTGALSIAPQVLDSVFDVFDVTLYTIVGQNYSTKASVDIAFDLSGVAKVTATSEASGFHLYSQVYGGAINGMEDFTLTPSAAPATPAPAKAPAINGVREIRGTVRTNAPSVEHLSFKGVYNRRKLNVEPIL